MYRPKEEDRLITTKEAAGFLGCCPNTLERRRCYGYGAPYRKIGRLVRYRLGDLIDYRDANKVDPRDRPE
jgi:hypothetical protein